MKHSQKWTPTYDLASIKEVLSSTKKLRMTVTARKNAATLGFSDTEVVATIQGLARTDFYKSMTSHIDSKIWQDVYHFQHSKTLTLYLKFTLDEDGHLVLSFKEK